MLPVLIDGAEVGKDRPGKCHPHVISLLINFLILLTPVDTVDNSPRHWGCLGTTRL
jgi:hypothetical protein